MSLQERCYGSRGLRLIDFNSERRFFASRRRRTEPRLGAVTDLRALRRRAHGEHRAVQAVFEVVEGAAALGVGKRCAFRDVDGELHLTVGGVDALAAQARCLCEPLRQVRRGDDEVAGDPWAGRDGQVLHAAHTTFLHPASTNPDRSPVAT